MLFDPLKEGLKTSVHHMSKTIEAALWHPYHSVKQTLKKTMHTKPDTDIVSMALLATKWQQCLDHLAVVITTSLCPLARKKRYKKLLTYTAREILTLHPVFSQAVGALHDQIPTLFGEASETLTSQELKQTAVLVDTLQKTLLQVAPAYEHRPLESSTDTYGIPFDALHAKELWRKAMHTLQEQYISQQKTLLHDQQQLYHAIQNMGEIKSAVSTVSSLMTRITKTVHTMTALQKEINDGEKRYDALFQSWLQPTLRGMKQAQKLSSQHASDGVTGLQQQYAIVCTEWTKKYQAWAVETALLPLSITDAYTQYQQYLHQLAHMQKEIRGVAGMAHAGPILRCEGWLQLVQQHRDHIGTLRALYKEHGLLGTLLMQIKKSHIRLSELCVKRLIEIKVVQHVQVDRWLAEAEKVHTILQQWEREDIRTKQAKIDADAWCDAQEQRLSSLHTYLDMMVKLSQKQRRLMILDVAMSGAQEAAKHIPFTKKVWLSLQKNSIGKKQLLAVQREDAEQSYRIKPTPQQQEQINYFEQQWTVLLQETALIDHLLAEIDFTLADQRYIVEDYRSQQKACKKDIKTLGAQLKKLLPHIINNIAMYPGFPVLKKNAHIDF